MKQDSIKPRVEVGQFWWDQDGDLCEVVDIVDIENAYFMVRWYSGVSKRESLTLADCRRIAGEHRGSDITWHWNDIEDAEWEQIEPAPLPPKFASRAEADAWLDRQR